ncbi:MAG TPA: hypothetical protein VJK48_06075 [Chlamydiales bacterium]|nr:hypothetical protein [Chlamydiales bacterium]
MARFTENSAQTTPVDESPYSPAGALDGRITSENGQTPFIPLSCSDLLFAGSKRSFETNPASTHKKPKSNSPYGAPRLNGSHIDAPLGYKQHVNQSGIFGNHGDGQVGIDLEELFGCEEAVVPPHEDDVFIVGSNNRDPYSFEEIEFWEAVCALVLPK